MALMSWPNASGDHTIRLSPALTHMHEDTHNYITGRRHQEGATVNCEQSEVKTPSVLIKHISRHQSAARQV